MTHEEIESRLSVLEATVNELASQMGTATVSLAALMGHLELIDKEQVKDVLAKNNTLQKALKRTPPIEIAEDGNLVFAEGNPL